MHGTISTSDFHIDFSNLIKRQKENNKKIKIDKNSKEARNVKENIHTILIVGTNALILVFSVCFSLLLRIKLHVAKYKISFVGDRLNLS